MALSDLGSKKATASAFPHYFRPYRGLPVEIRMMIWQLAIGPGTLFISPSPFPQDYGNYYHWDGNFIDNFEDFNFSILLLNKEVQLEAMEIAKDKFIWHFTGSYYGHMLSYLLGHLSPFQKQMVGEISIASGSLTNRYEFSRINERLALTEPYNLTIRLTLPDDLRKSLILCGGVGDIRGYSALEVKADLAEELRLIFWDKRTARTIYRLLNDEHVKAFKLQHEHGYEDLRPYFSNPTRLLFDNHRFRHYLSVTQSSKLHVELDWPIESKLLSICITKRGQGHFRAALSD